MGREDAVLALDRHATSKVRSAADLVGVATFGFRGEALPAIASVSRFGARDQRRRDAAPSSASPAAGSTGSPTPSRQRGTTITVRALFFNTPARRKFLRSAASETRAAQEALATLALAHPDVGFELDVDGTTPARGAARPGAGGAAGRGLGTRARRHADPGATTRPARFEVGGFVQRPGDAQPTGPPDPAVRERTAVQGSVPRARRRGGLSLRHPPGRPALGLPPDRGRPRRRGRQRPPGQARGPVPRSDRRRARGRGRRAPRARRARGRGAGGRLATAAGGSASAAGLPVGGDCDELFAAADDSPDRATDRVAAPEPLGFQAPLLQLFDTYIVYEAPEGLVIVDQHSAHERVLFEAVMAQLTGADAPAQRLLLPLTLELTDEELDAVERHGEQLRRVGFEAEAFGGRAVVLHAVPVAASAVRRRRLLPRAGRRPRARPVRRLGQPARAVRGHLRLPRGGQGGAAGSTSGRCASCCSGSSPPISRRTTCTGARPSCSCRARSWSDGLGGGRVPVVVGPDRRREDGGGARARGPLAARDPLGRLPPGLPPARHRHRQADAEGARAGAAPRARPRRSRHALQRGALRPGRRRAGWPTSAAGARCRSWSAARGSTSGRWPKVSFASRRSTRRDAASLDAFTARLEPLELLRWAGRLDPGFRGGGRQRAARAIEVALLSGPPALLVAGRRRARGARWTRGTLCSPCPGPCCTSGSRGGRRRWCSAA